MGCGSFWVAEEKRCIFIGETLLRYNGFWLLLARQAGVAPAPPDRSSSLFTFKVMCSRGPGVSCPREACAAGHASSFPDVWEKWETVSAGLAHAHCSAVDMLHMNQIVHCFTHIMVVVGTAEELWLSSCPLKTNPLYSWWSNTAITRLAFV